MKKAKQKVNVLQVTKKEKHHLTKMDYIYYFKSRAQNVQIS